MQDIMPGAFGGLAWIFSLACDLWLLVQGVTVKCGVALLQGIE